MIGTAAQAAPVGAAGYTVTQFATAPVGSSSPDSIAVVGGNVYVGYGNGGKPDGSGGAVSTIAEFSGSGTLLNTTSVIGHNDGLRYDAATNRLWAIQNEDSNPNLVLLTPGSLAQSAAIGFSATPHGGGYDDVAFAANGQAYITASNPAGNGPYTAPALVSGTISGGTVNVAGVLNGNATATTINGGGPTTLNLSDPDSLIFAPNGQLVLDSQGDSQLVFITAVATASQAVSVLNLSNQVDDTVFASGGMQTLLFSNKGNGTVYAVTGNFAAGAAFSATASNGTVAGNDFIGSLNLTSGLLTPIVTGASNPGGEAFLTQVQVPEPASVNLLGASVVGVLGLARRRRAKPSLA